MSSSPTAYTERERGEGAERKAACCFFFTKLQKLGRFSSPFSHRSRSSRCCRHRPRRGNKLPTVACPRGRRLHGRPGSGESFEHKHKLANGGRESHATVLSTTDRQTRPVHAGKPERMHGMTPQRTPHTPPPCSMAREAGVHHRLFIYLVHYLVCSLHSFHLFGESWLFYVCFSLLSFFLMHTFEPLGRWRHAPRRLGSGSQSARCSVHVTEETSWLLMATMVYKI